MNALLAGDGDTCRLHVARFAKVLLILLAVACICATASGCSSLDRMMGDDDRPRARVRGVNLQGLTLDGATLGFDVEVTNPYPLPLPLVNLDYNLVSQGRSFFNGAAPLSGTIPAHGSRLVTLPATFAFRDVLAILSDIQPGAIVPYVAELGLGVDAPGLGLLTLPLRKEGELPVPAVPEVQVAGIDIKSLSLSEASAVIQLDVKNLNQFKATLNGLNYALSLGGYDIAAAAVDRSVAFKPGEQERLSIPVSFDPRALGMAALNMLRSNSATYEIDGLMDFETPFGNMNLPFSRIGETLLRR
ncbi:MAG: LEA type 2 family protein [Phycisphaerales bacterium]